jgi:excisionase family DNA binding protein
LEGRTLQTDRQSNAALKVGEVAEALRVGRNRVYELIESGDLRAVRLGPRSIRVTREALAEFLGRGGRDSAA